MKALALLIVVALAPLAAYASPRSGVAAPPFLVERPVPAGDWVATVQYRIDYGSEDSTVFLGFGDWSQNTFVARVWTESDASGASARTGVERASRGERHEFQRVQARVAGAGDSAGHLRELTASLPETIQVRLTRRGDRYVAAMRPVGRDGGWVELEPWWHSAVHWEPTLPGLVQEGRLGFSAAGSSVVSVEWMRVEPLSGSAD